MIMSKSVTVGDFTYTGAAEIREAAEWLENDAAYLRVQAEMYAARGDSFTAPLVAANAAHSAEMAAKLRAAM